MALENADPNRKYVWVSRNKLTLAEYRRMGYVPETIREGGVQAAGEELDLSHQGKQVEACDHVLMSVSAERAQDIFERGPFGASGQKLTDAIDKKIVTKRGGEDHFRGLGVERRGGQRPYFAVENETSDLAPDGEN